MLGHPAFIPMGQDPFAKALDATPTPGWFSAMPVAIDDAFTEGTGNSLFRIARDAFDMSPPMSAEEANAKYGHSGMQFYGPVQEETALRRYRAKLEERDRKAFLERADLGFASNLTAGLLSSLFDPAEMAINIGIALTATPAASGARIAGQAGMRASLMSGAARGAIEGAAGAAISEIPIGIASNLYQFDHTYADALFSIGGGAILGGFFGGLGGAMSYRYRPRADQETHTAATQLAVAQAMSGQKPDVTPAFGESPPLEVRFALRLDGGGFDASGNPRFAEWTSDAGSEMTDVEARLAVRINDIIKRIVPDAEVQFGRILRTGDVFDDRSRMDRAFGAHGVNPESGVGGVHGRRRTESGELKSIIAVSLGGGMPLRDARHETIHALRAGGFFTSEEWETLVAEATRAGGWVDKYKKPSTDKGIEEAIADAFGQWGLITEPEAKTIFSKIDALIKRVKAALAGMGYTRWEQVFADIETGRIGGRKEKKTASGVKKLELDQLSLRDDPYYQSAIARVGMTDIAEAIRSGDRGNIERSAANPQTVEKAARTIAEYDGMAGAADAPLEEALGFLRAEYGADVEPKTLERRFAKILENQRSAGMAEPPPADITARADEPTKAQEPEPEAPPVKPEPGQEPKLEASAEPPAPPAEPPTTGLFDAIDDILRRIAPFAKREYLDRIDPRRFGRAQEAAQAHLGKPVTEEDLAGLEVDGVAYIRAGDVIVELAKRVIGGDPDAIARHEAIHALRLAGLFTDAEWNTLLHWARKDWARRYGKTTDDLGLEEAIADAFADWAKGNLVIQSEKPRTIMGRIRDFWTGVVDRLGGELSPRDIFDAVERGKIGRRGLGKEGSFGFEARKRAAMAAVGRTETYATEGVQDPDPAPPSRAAEGQGNADPSPAVEEINDITESLRADLDAGLISQQEFDEAMQAMQAATTRPAEMRKAMTEAVACELS